MDDFSPLGSQAWFLTLAFLALARGFDILSTWVATPNLVLEGNPIAKTLGWRWGIPVNLGICFAMAFWALPSVVLGTTSILVAARNFQSAWLMRSMGEYAYRDWHVQRIQETPITLFLLCLAGNTVLTAAVGGIVIYFSGMALVPFGLGVGIIGYAAAVAVFTLLAIYRLRRASIRSERRAARSIPVLSDSAAAAPKLLGIYASEGLPPQGK